jgi:hypothetical protein
MQKFKNPINNRFTEVNLCNSPHGEFEDKVSKFEQRVNSNIANGAKDFSDKHPLIATTFKASLHILPPPFDGIAGSIYDSFNGTDEQKFQQVKTYLNTLQNQGEVHYNNIASQMAEFKEIVANERTLLEIKDIIISKDDNINQKLDAIIEAQKSAREKYLDDHSMEIARIIYQSWAADSGIFASFRYEDGIKYDNEPHEPQITNSGLARQHLVSGYGDNAWKFYAAGKAESVEKSNEIKAVIDLFEKLVYFAIERDIQTATGNHKVERKSREEFFTREAGFETYPTSFDFNNPLDPELVWQIFQEANNRNNIKETITDTWLFLPLTLLNIGKKC